jgi:hypothetical protein
MAESEEPVAAEVAPGPKAAADEPALPPSKRQRRESLDADQTDQTDQTDKNVKTPVADEAQIADSDPQQPQHKASAPAATPPAEQDAAGRTDQASETDGANTAADPAAPEPVTSAPAVGAEIKQETLTPVSAQIARPLAAQVGQPAEHELAPTQKRQTPQLPSSAQAAAPQYRPAPPPHEQGVQQKRGNSVLPPEVAEVLNGLFERGFFQDRDIDGRAIDLLASVSPELALAALDDIQHRDFSTVRTKPAFIYSIFKGVVTAGGSAPPSHVPLGGFPPATVPPSALAHLPPQVSEALQRVFTSGVCHPSQFDDRAMDILVELHPVDAVRSLSEFASMEPGRVRNPSAFWMGLARKYKSNAVNGGGIGAPGPMGGGTNGPQGMGYGGSGGAGGSGGFVPHGMGGSMGMGGNMGGPGHGGGGYGNHMATSSGGGGGGGFSNLDRRLNELANMGVLRHDALDDRASDALRKLPELEALSVLAELPDPSRVRNMSAYVMGLCKKFASGEARSLSSGGRGPIGPGGNGPMGGGFGMGGGGPMGGGFGHGGPGGFGPKGAGGGPGGGFGMGGPSGPGGGCGDGDPRELHDALGRMDPEVRGRFYAMVDRGMFRENEFDYRAMGALQGLNVTEACAALDELAASDPRRINNISAYFMGLCKAKKFGRA